MNTTIASLVRSTALAASLLALPLLASAKDTAADSAARQLAIKGSVPVAAAGPYVEVGTFQIQVVAKLGQPGTKLADGSWLYSNFSVNDSDAAGSLVVRFVKGRVSELSLVTPAVAMAMSAPSKTSDNILVAASR